MGTSPWEACAAALRLAMEGVEQLPISCMSGDDAMSLLHELHSTRSMLESVICRFLAEAEAGEAGGAETGHRSAATHLAAITRSNPRTARADQNLGTWLSGYPAFADAFSAGIVSKEHVRAIRARENPRTRARLHESQDLLIDAATTCPWREFLAVLRYWDLAADPDGLEPDEQVQARQVRYTKRADGTVTGRFTLDPLNGHAFLTAVEQRVQQFFRDDAESGSLRTAAQRRADAMVDLVTSSSATSTTAPLLHIVMSEQVAAAHLAAVATDAGPDELPLDRVDADRRCELIDGTPLHPNFAIATMAAAVFRRLVFSTDGEQVDLGRRTRGFPKHLKEALLVRARGRCQFPGCDAPVSWMQADHVIPWSKGGVTSIRNGQILCDPHNKMKRDGPSPPVGR